MLDNAVLNNLKKSINRNRFSHAYLFVGEKGSGKLEMAKTFAKLLYCSSVDKPCNECLSCKQIDSLIHPNITYIYPDGLSIKNEQIDKLQSEFSKTSLVDGKRIYIIDNADKLTLTSSNRLLKFIEEPINKDTIGILISENYSKILPTIISRCQVILFSAPSKDIIEKELLEKGYTEGLSHLLPYLSKNINEAIKYVENNHIDMIIELIKNMGKAYIENKSMVLFFNKNLDLLYSNNENTKLFMKLIITYFKDILYVKNGYDNIAFKDELDTIKLIAKKNLEKSILKVLEILLDCSCKLSYNVNQVLLIERALLEIERG